MALSRDTPLLTAVTQVVDLTGVQDLSNLEGDAEFSIADTLLASHKWVFDRLERRFNATELAAITNGTRLERAVAYHFLELLAAGGYLGGGQGERAADEGARDYWGLQAREEVDAFKPEFGDAADEPRRADEGIPVVRNVARTALFGGQLS